MIDIFSTTSNSSSISLTATSNNRKYHHRQTTNHQLLTPVVHGNVNKTFIGWESPPPSPSSSCGGCLGSGDRGECSHPAAVAPAFDLCCAKRSLLLGQVQQHQHQSLFSSDMEGGSRDSKNNNLPSSSYSPTPLVDDSHQDGGGQRATKRIKYSHDVHVSDCSWLSDDSMVDSILWLFQKERKNDAAKQESQRQQQPQPPQSQSLFDSLMWPISSAGTGIGRADGLLLESPMREQRHATESQYFVPERLAVDNQMEGTRRRSTSSKVPTPMPATSSSPSAVAASSNKGHSSHKEAWDHHFQNLLEFKRQHGHCRVPDRYPENPALAGWVRRQRCDYQQHELQVQQQLQRQGQQHLYSPTTGSLSSSSSINSSSMYQGSETHASVRSARREALLEVGFDFDPQKTKWEDKFAQLIEYQLEHGHCKPTPRDEDSMQLRQLAHWVKAQRRHYNLFVQGKSSPMTRERIERLNSINFVWNPRLVQQQQQQQQQSEQQKQRSYYAL